MLLLPILAAVVLLAVAGIQLRAASRALTEPRPHRIEPAAPSHPDAAQPAVLTAPAWAAGAVWRGPDDEG